MPRPRPKQEHENVTRRLARETDSTVVSLTRSTDGRRFTRVGVGPSHPQRYAAALAQLPSGDYRVDAVSTPGTVYADVLGRDRMLADPRARGARPMGRYEGKRVVIS